MVAKEETGEGASAQLEREADEINSIAPDAIAIGRIFLAVQELAAKGKLTQDLCDAAIADVRELVPNVPELDLTMAEYRERLEALLDPHK